MSLTIKAFLERKEGSAAEIRRFSVPADASSSYEYLSKKIGEIFPSLKRGRICLFWRDPENDLIAFSTDEELLEALGFINDGIFRIHIKELPTSTDESRHGDLHPGVVCDGCEGGIHGTRYKCMVCRDYDLCSNCEKDGKHKEHNMMKITSPLGFGAPPPYGAWCGPHGQYGPQGGPPGPHGPGFMPPHFRRWMNRFMKRWHSQNDQDGCPCAEAACPCPEAKKKKSEEANDHVSDEESTQASGGVPQQDYQNMEEDYLKTVGDQVADMLGPLGIDVTVDVETGGRRVSCGKTGGKKGYGSCPRRGHCGKGQCPRGQSTGPTPGTSDEQQAASPPETEMEAESTEPKSPEGEKTQDVADQSTKPVDEEWTVLNGDKGEEAPRQDMTDGAPGPSKDEKARITEALDQMSSMGFDVNDPFVTNAVINHNGDIARALDSLKISDDRLA